MKPAAPVIRTITLHQPLRWLALGWRDIGRCGWLSFAHGLVLTLFGWVLLGTGHNHFWLLAGAFSGLLVVAPILATSLYCMSRLV